MVVCKYKLASFHLFFLWVGILGMAAVALGISAVALGITALLWG